jgi:thioredoxin-related protein
MATQFFKERTEPFRQRWRSAHTGAFQSYGVSGTPTFVLVDANGKVKSYKTGYNATVGLGIEGWSYSAAAKK